MEPMDDDTEIPAGNGGDNIRYGEIGTLNTANLLQAGIAAGNIYRQSGGEAEVMELPEVRDPGLIRRAFSRFVYRSGNDQLLRSFAG